MLHQQLQSEHTMSNHALRYLFLHFHIHCIFERKSNQLNNNKYAQ